MHTCGSRWGRQRTQQRARECGLRESTHTECTFCSSNDVTRCLALLSTEVADKLSLAQRDETTWSAQSWRTFQSQKLSVALHAAVAFEIASELGIAAVSGMDAYALSAA